MSENKMHTVDYSDPDDAPDLSAPEWIEKVHAAPLRDGHRVVRRGRPLAAQQKISTTLRLDADVLTQFRATGSGWQTRVNAALRKSLGI